MSNYLYVCVLACAAPALWQRYLVQNKTHNKMKTCKVFYLNIELKKHLAYPHSR